MAEKLGVPAAQVSKVIKEKGIAPDQKKGACSCCGPQAVKAIQKALK